MLCTILNLMKAIPTPTPSYNTYLDLSSISINLPAVMMVGHNHSGTARESSWRVANEHAAAKLKYPLNLCEIVFDNSSGDNNEK
jgi:hypothetical protein